MNAERQRGRRNTEHIIQRLPSLIRRAFFVGDSKAFAVTQQTIFSVVVLLTMSLLIIFRPSMQLQFIEIVAIIFGIALILFATTAALLIPKKKMGLKFHIMLPVLDLVALGILRIATMPDGGPLSVLALFPAIWLVTQFRWWGVVFAFVGATVAISVPTIALSDTPVDLPQFILYSALPIAVLMVSTLVVGLHERLTASRLRTVRALHREEALSDDAKRTARLLSSIGQSLSVGVLVIDRCGNDMMWNEAQRKIHRLVSPESNFDRTEAGHLIFYPDGVTPIPVDQRPAYRAMRGERFDNLLFCAGEAGESQRVVSVSARIVLDEDGEHEATVLIFNDVTETQKIIRAREEFIATVSHELRTPLTSIIGYAELAVDDIDDEPEAPIASSPIPGYLDVIRRNAEQLSVLVEDLLLEQQARQGKLQLRLQMTELDKFVRKTVQSLQPAALEKGITLTAETGRTPALIADPQRISQVLDNLISNAVKYTQYGGKVTVSTVTEDTHVDMEVNDNGPGLSKNEVDQLFTPFFRSDSALQSSAKGAGLGLAVAKSIVEAHGGHISIDTTPGVGTTFRIRIPRDSRELT
ncbi:sensor histidine kinase [Humidisolicoccus flavus]|uniref:sensor histidine kinase n=1 Tax=Humidisolicoccus flavus TaxID=3111414 RepID=UPI003248E170